MQGTHNSSQATATDEPDESTEIGLQAVGRTEMPLPSEFGVFSKAPTVRYLVVPRAFSRAELGRLEEIAKEWGAKGLAYLVNDGGEIRSPIAKFLSEEELKQVQPEPGNTTLFVADEEATVSRVRGESESSGE